MDGVTHERAARGFRFGKPRAYTNMANPMVRMPDGRLIVRTRASDAFSLSVLRCIIVTFGAADGEVLTESSISFHFNRVAHGGGVRSLCLCGFVKRGVRCGVDGGDDDIFDTE